MKKESGASPTRRTIAQMVTLGAISLSFVGIAPQAAAASACVNSPIVQWAAAAGGNGHYYQAICADGLDWEEAKVAAEARGGHLATSTSAEENSFIYDLIDDPSFWTTDGNVALGPFLGGFQTEPCGSGPTGCWSWVTGEPWGFTSWHDGEPNDYEAGEDSLGFFGCCDAIASRSQHWNDIASEVDPDEVVAHVVEWDSGIPHTATLKCKNAKKSKALLTWDDPNGNPVDSEKLACKGKKKTTRSVEQPRNADGYTLKMKTKNEEREKQKCSDTESFTAGETQAIAEKCKEKPAKAKFKLV